MTAPDLATGEPDPSVLNVAPQCPACWENGERRPAQFLLPQSHYALADKPVTWVLVCKFHADGWNRGGDNWITNPPGYALVPLPYFDDDREAFPLSLPAIDPPDTMVELPDRPGPFALTLDDRVLHPATHTEVIHLVRDALKAVRCIRGFNEDGLIDTFFNEAGKQVAELVNYLEEDNPPKIPGISYA